MASISPDWGTAVSMDVLLVSMPNKNIDYPGLSLPVLTAALRKRGFIVDQMDLNVLLRDTILTAHGLSQLLECTLPYYAQYASGTEDGLRALLRLLRYLERLRREYGFASLEEVKLRVQARDYIWVFGEERRFRQYLELFKINRGLHYLIDVAVTLSEGSPQEFLGEHVRQLVDHVLAVVKRENPTLVGVSILDIQRLCSLRLIRALREVYKGKIVVGGPDPTRFWRGYADMCPDIDAVFFREAEVSLPAFLESLESQAGMGVGVPGVSYRCQAGVVTNRHRPLNMTDDTPTPDFRGLPLHMYLTPALPVQASRGCCWQQCRFCIHWNTYCHFQTRDPASVVEDIGRLVAQHNTRYFHFTDDCIPVLHARRLVDLVSKESPDIRWLAYFRLEPDLDAELLRAIQRGGGRILEMGLESASNRVLALMNKNIRVEDAHRIVEDAAQAGLLVKLFMFHGFPGETLEEAESTVSFTERCIRERKVRAFLPLRNRFELLRGSDVYQATIEGREEEIQRCWEPSGLFGIRAEYELRSSETAKRHVINGFVQRVRDYMRTERVYNTDDENVMLDLLVLDHSPLRAGWRCI